MKVVVVALFLGFAAGSSAVCAAEISGPRVEAVLGWERLDTLFTTGNGLTYGLGAGYDISVMQVLSLGIDGEITGTTVSNDLAVYWWDGSREVGARGQGRRDLYIGGRLTGKVAERVAVYVKAGYANGQFSIRPQGDSGFYTAVSETRGGLRGGFGAQYLFDKVYTGVEYRYTDYGSRSFFGKDRRHQVVGTVGYRF